MNEGKRAKRQPTKFSKKMPSLSDEDEDKASSKTLTDEEKEEFKGGEDKTGSKSDEMSEDSEPNSDDQNSNSKGKNGSMMSGSNKKDEK